MPGKLENQEIKIARAPNTFKELPGNNLEELKLSSKLIPESLNKVSNGSSKMTSSDMGDDDEEDEEEEELDSEDSE